VAFLVVLPVPLWSLQRLAERVVPQLAAHLACDPTGAVFAALGCNFVFTTRKLRPDTIHAHTGVARAALGGLWEGLTGGMQGDPRQMGCAFVLDAEGSALWAHKDAFNADQVPIPVLLAAAGLEPAALYTHGGPPPLAAPAAGAGAGGSGEALPAAAAAAAAAAATAAAAAAP
jgi:hypothetical protein